MSFFFFHHTATTELYTLSLHDALPISPSSPRKPSSADVRSRPAGGKLPEGDALANPRRDRKSTRLNSSHSQISYAVFCLKKKKCIRRLPGKLLQATAIRTRSGSRSTIK